MFQIALTIPLIFAAPTSTLSTEIKRAEFVNVEQVYQLARSSKKCRVIFNVVVNGKNVIVGLPLINNKMVNRGNYKKEAVEIIDRC